MKLYSLLPNFEESTEWINGRIHEQELRDLPVLIHFWSISCTKCKDALLQISQWPKVYSEFRLKIVGIHMPRSERDTDIMKVKEIIQKYELAHPQIIDNYHVFTDLFENRYVPSYYLFDGESKLRHYQAGEDALPMVKRRLHRILGIEQ